MAGLSTLGHDESPPSCRKLQLSLPLYTDWVHGEDSWGGAGTQRDRLSGCLISLASSSVSQAEQACTVPHMGQDMRPARGEHAGGRTVAGGEGEGGQGAVAKRRRRRGDGRDGQRADRARYTVPGWVAAALQPACEFALRGGRPYHNLIVRNELTQKLTPQNPCQRSCHAGALRRRACGGRHRALIRSRPGVRATRAREAASPCCGRMHCM